MNNKELQPANLLERLEVAIKKLDRIGGSSVTADEVAQVVETIVDSFRTSTEELEKEFGKKVDSCYSEYKLIENLVERLEKKTDADYKAILGMVSHSSESFERVSQIVEKTASEVRKELRQEMRLEISKTIKKDSFYDQLIKRATSVIEDKILPFMTSRAIRDQFNKTLVDEKIDAKDIDNLEENIDATKIKNLPKATHTTTVVQQPGGFVETAIKAGSGVTVTKDAFGSWVVSSTATGSGHTIQDEGTPLTQRTNLNFVGAGVTVTDDSGNDATVVTISTSAGAGFQAPTGGSVNGSNKDFTWASAPNALVVDGVSLRKVATDGTVNWTGTTTTSLTVAPNFDVYGVA